MIGGDWRLPLGAVLGLNAALGRNAVFAGVTVVSIAASVALATSLELSSRAVQRMADATAEALAGAAQLEVVAGELGIPERLVAELRALPGVAAASPMLTTNLAVPAAKLSVHVLGIDLLEEGAGREVELAARGAEVPDKLKLLARADAIVVSELVAAKTGVGFDESVAVHGPLGPRALHVEGVLADRGVARAFGGQIAVMDLYALQALVGREGSVDRIDIVPAAGADVAALRAEIERRVAGAATVRRPGMRQSSLDQTLAALRAAVLMIAAVGSVVAAVLSYAAMSTAAERRLAEFAVLRATGFSARDVARLIASDSLAVAALGTALGFAAGRVLATVLIPTLTNVSEYFDAGAPRAGDVSVSGATVALALAVGVASALCGALGPARLATRRYVLDETRESGGESLAAPGGCVRVGWVAALLAALGAVALWPGVQPHLRLSLELGLGTVWAGLLVTPALGRLDQSRETLSRVLPGVGHLAGTGLSVRPRGTVLAVASITCLVAFVTGAILLSSSFRDTLLQRVRNNLPDAINVSAGALFENAGSIRVQPDAIETLRRTPGLAELAEHVVTIVLVRGEEVPLVAFEYGAWLRRKRDLAPRQREILEAMLRGEVGVTRAFAANFGVGPGDSLELPTRDGVRSFHIAGERDGMASKTGIVFMDLATFDRHWPRVGADSVALFPSGDPESLIEAARAATFSQQSLFFTRNAELLERAEKFALRFDGLLLAIATLTLVLGGVAIANLLVGSVAARRRELVLLRTAGAAPDQLAALVLIDAALIAGFSALVGLALGVVIAQPFIEILGAEFGVYVDTHADPVRLASLLALVAGSVLVSALYPALLARRTTTLEVTSFG